MKQLNVGIVFTGLARYIDSTSRWWKDFAEHSTHNITYYNSTWDSIDQLFAGDAEELKSLLKTNENRIVPVVNNVLTKGAICLTEVNSYKKETPEHLMKIIEDGPGWNYSFGRQIQFSRALETFEELRNYDVIIHTRWDVMVDNFFQTIDDVIYNTFLNKCWSCTGINIIDGNYYVDDTFLVAHSSCAYQCFDNSYNLYRNLLKIFESLYNLFGPEYFNKPDLLYNYVINHNQMLRYLMYSEQTVLNLDFIVTLFRQGHDSIPYNFTQDYFNTVSEQYLPSDFTRDSK